LLKLKKEEINASKIYSLSGKFAEWAKKQPCYRKNCISVIVARIWEKLAEFVCECSHNIISCRFIETADGFTDSSSLNFKVHFL